MPRRRATQRELDEQFRHIRAVLARSSEGLAAPEIRADLDQLFGLRLDARILRLRLSTLIATGEIIAQGATRGRRYQSAHPADRRHGAGGATDSLFVGLPRPKSRPPDRTHLRPASRPGRRSGVRPPSPPRVHEDLFAFEEPRGAHEKEVERGRYLSLLRWQGADGFFIEFDPGDLLEEAPSLHLGPTGRIPTFSTIDEALLHAERMGFELEDAMHVFGEYDLDHIQAWCENPRFEDIEYELFVHVLGLIAQLPDIDFDEALTAAHDASDAAFSKLLRSTEPELLPGEPFPYIAEWTPEDIASMKRTFELGLRAFSRRLVAWPPRL